MKSLALVGGDLSVGPGGFQTVTGAARIHQDLALFLGEDAGSDRFHPQWGSVVAEYIGQPLDEETKFHVKSEVGRVIQQYINSQNSVLNSVSLNGERSNHSTDDIVVEVVDIQVEALYDTLKVSASLVTASGRAIRVSRTVNA